MKGEEREVVRMDFFFKKFSQGDEERYRRKANRDCVVFKDREGMNMFVENEKRLVAMERLKIS